MNKKVVITGATGLIGRQLTEMLLAQNYRPVWISRKKRLTAAPVPVFVWKVEENFLEEGALDGADAIVHLAGAKVAEGRWTEARKQLILDSRTGPTDLLHRKIKAPGRKPAVFVSASAVGLYGSRIADEPAAENSPAGSDFLASVVREWEARADRISALGLRTVKVRIGVVLSDKGGALEKLSLPVKVGAGAALGKGNQFIPWVHQHDLCRLFVRAIEDENFEGAYNAVAPENITNKEMTKQLAAVLKRPLFLPNIPEFALRLSLGEMSEIVLGGRRVSSEKVLQTGFTFDFPDIESALKNLMKK